MKLSTLLIPFLLLLLTVSCASDATNENSAKEITKIGVLLPMSGGKFDSYGRDAFNGVQLAYKQLGQDTVDYELVLVDTKGDSEAAKRAYQSLLDRHNPAFVVGDLLSSVCLSVAPIANESKTLTISPTASTSDLISEGSYMFSIYPAEVKEGGAVADIILEYSFDNIAVIYEATASTSQMVEAIESKVSSQSKILFTDAVQPDRTDFRNIITKYKNKGVETLVLVTYSNVAKLIIQQVNRLNWDVQLVSQSALYDNNLLEELDGKANGLYLTGSYFSADRTDSLTVSFRDDYVSLFAGTQPQIFAAQSYDAFNIGLVLIKRSNTLPLSQPIQFEINGVTGNHRYDGKSGIDKPFSVFRVDDGAFKLIK